MFALDLGTGLALRLHERRHAAELFQLIDANRAMLQRWFPWPDAVHAPSDVLQFIDHSLQRFAAGDGFEGGLMLNGRLVGGLGVHTVDRAVGKGELGYWLAQSAQGHGVMTRAVAGLVRHNFTAEGLERVEIRCLPENQRSRAIPERLRFREEGTLRRVGLMRGRPYDHVVYGLLRDEWRATRDAGRLVVGAEAETEIETAIETAIKTS